MTEDDFAHAVRQFCLEYGGSVSSGGRTDAHSVAIGGFKGDPHTWWYGADVLLDNPGIMLPGHNELVVQRAKDLGLKIIIERSHMHLQPLTYPSGPLTTEQVQAWKDRAT